MMVTLGMLITTHDEMVATMIDVDGTNVPVLVR